jgi:undecaprenyl-diphosphatase
MTYWTAIFLGIVQGLAEFLPISSSGHLAVFQHFLNIGSLDGNLFFDVLLHLGTLAAVIIAFWPDVSTLFSEGFVMLHLKKLPRGKKPDMLKRRLIWFIILGTLPLLVIVFFKKYVESLSDNMFFIAFAFVLTGALLFTADRLGHGNKDEKSATASDALIVGLAQAVAVTPGISRSGATICTGMLRGFDRNYAVRYSFLLSIPAVVGAFIMTLADAVKAGIEWSLVPMYLVGMVVAFVTGYAAIYLLRMIVQRGKFGGFAYYCWGAGLVTLVLALVA